MQHEGDDLHLAIRRYVAETVPPSLVDVVTELTARSVVLVMTTPEFYLHLTYVQELLAEIARLKPRQTARKAPRSPASPRKAPTTPVTSAKKPAPRVRPAKKAQPQPRSRNGQFKRGAQGR